MKNRNVLNGVVNVCSKVIGERQWSMNELYERQVRKNANAISNDNSHILAQYFERLSSGRRFRTFKARTRRFQNSFIPTSLLLLNK